jgi:hypothetical protein
MPNEVYVLNDDELDAVAAGQGLQLGLVNLQNILNNADVNILDNNKVTVQNIANGNNIQVGLGAAVAILGGAGAGNLQIPAV